MTALEAGKPTDAATAAPVSPEAAGRHIALSIRERRALLAVADFILASAASVIAYAAIHKPNAHPLEVADILIVGAVWVASLLISDAYAFQIPSNRAESGFAVVRAIPVAILLLVLVFFIRPYVMTRPVIAGTIILGAALLALMRITVARALLHESLALRAILVSDTEPSIDIAATLRAARFEYRLVGRLVRPIHGAPERARLVEDVREMLGRTRAEEVIVTNSELRLVPGVVEACLTRGVRLVSAGDLVERYMGRVPIDSVDVHWYLGLPDSDVWRRPYAAARRVFDLILAFAISIPFLVLLPFVTLLIKVDSPGSVFLVQRRVGESGREFDLLKLRTMSHDAEAGGAQFATAGDPRVTRVGRVLRATRFDEFPQLLNIIRGEMSFIGPRPERPEFVSDLEAKIPHFRSRLLVKPGLTGWAQVNGGYARTVPEITRKLEYDLYYIKKRSFRLDLQILGATFATVVRRRGL